MIQKIFKENLIFYFILLISVLTALVVALSNTSTFDAGDGIQHYLIARYSWEHPYLLLDLWGKPIFTLFSSPFAQFGLKGMYVFNILCAIITSILSYSIVKKLHLSYTWSVPVFIFFSPIYFAVINSGLTEIFFSTLLTFSIWLAFKGKHNYAAIVASFLPFARPEGYLYIFLFAIYLLFDKKFIILPLLCLGFILYSIIGYFYYKDILWIISNNYALQTDIYKERNPFYHYIIHYNAIWGTAYFILLLVGIAVFFYMVFNKKQKNTFFMEELLLITGFFFSILLLHSTMTSASWIHNNLGMMRFMVSLIPSSTIIALHGLNFVTNIFAKPIKNFIYTPYIQYFIVIIFLFFIIKTPFQQWYYPFQPNNEQRVIIVSEKFLKSIIKNQKVYYLHPYISIVAGLDPFNTEKTTLLWSVDTTKMNQIPDSSVFIWDSHFAPLEGRMPLRWLQNNNYFMPLKHYKYHNEQYPFELWIFLKTKRDNPQTDSIPTEIVTDFGLLDKLQKVDSLFIDCENTSFLEKKFITQKVSYSGKYSLKYSSESEWGPVFAKSIKDISRYQDLKKIKFSFQIYPIDSIGETIIVIETKRDDAIIEWQGIQLNDSIVYPNQWNAYSIERYLSKEVDKNDIVRIYFWNKSRKHFYVDDICIYYYSIVP